MTKLLQNTPDAMLNRLVRLTICIPYMGDEPPPVDTAAGTTFNLTLARHLCEAKKCLVMSSCIFCGPSVPSLELPTKGYYRPDRSNSHSTRDICSSAAVGLATHREQPCPVSIVVYAAKFSDLCYIHVS